MKYIFDFANVRNIAKSISQYKFLFLIGIIFFYGCPFVWASKNVENNFIEIEVVGRAQILNFDEQGAFDRAKEFGLRQAVESVVGTSLLSQTKVLDATLVEDNIFSRSVGYVQDFRIVKEWNEKRDKFSIKKVKMLVRVKKKLLEDDVLSLRSLQLRLDLPLLHISVEEGKTKSEHKDKIFPISVSSKKLLASAVQKEFLEKQFYFLDYENVQGNNADVRLIFSAYYSQNNISFLESLGEGFTSVRVFVHVKAIRSDSKFLLFSKSVSGAGAGLNMESSIQNALDKILSELTGELSQKLINVWRKETEVGKDFFLVFSHVNAADTQKIRQALSPQLLEGVELVIDKGWQDKKIRFLVRYRYTLAQLIDIILSLEDIPFGLEILHYGSRTLHFRAK